MCILAHLHFFTNSKGPRVPRDSQVPGLLPGHLRNIFVWF